MKRIPELDGIRGVAILMVLFYHYFSVSTVVTMGSFTSRALVPSRLGWSGVDLFFALSGFLIGGILIDARESANYFKTFYIRRFYRIVPIYAVVVFGCYCVVRAVEAGHLAQLSAILDDKLPWTCYVLFAQNFCMAHSHSWGGSWLGATWSLAIEEQFYLTLPLVIYLCPRRWLRALLVAGIVAVPLFRTLSYFRSPDDPFWRHFMMPLRADGLLLGVLAALTMRTASHWAWIERHGRQLQSLIAVLVAGSLILSWKSPYLGSEAIQTFGYTWLALMYVAILVYALSQRESLLSRVLRSAPLTFAGTLAYGIYLLHSPVILWLSGWLNPNHRMIEGWPALDSWQQFFLRFLAIGLTFGICQLSFTYFEKPLVDVGHRTKYVLR